MNKRQSNMVKSPFVYKSMDGSTTTEVKIQGRIKVISNMDSIVVKRYSLVT